MLDHTTDIIAASHENSPIMTEPIEPIQAAAQAAQLEQLGHALLKSMFATPGELDPMVRQAIYRCAKETPSPDPFHPDAIEGVPRLLSVFAHKVIRHAYKVTDADVQRLLDSGYAEDALFEAIVSAATGAGMLRIEQGLLSMTAITKESDAPAQN